MIVDVAIEHDAWARLGSAQSLIERAALAAVAGTGVVLAPDCELSVLLAGDERVRGLNRAYRGKDSATNVLAFPQSHVPGQMRAQLGDVALAFETVAGEAQEQGKTLGDHASHLIVHGVLHLLGYDHMNDEDASTMETLEQVILAGIGITDPYAMPLDAET